MTKIKVADATGPVLDWMVTKVLGITEIGQPDGVSFEEEWSVMHGSGDFNFCTDWAQGGPIIERELIDIQAKFNSGSNTVPKGQWYWQASTVNEDDVAYWFDGPTPLVAAMRCFCASKLGDEVDVPEELLV